MPISACYERVWRCAARSGAVPPAMAVTYRLQGLDGEATEPQVASLEEGAPTEDPEVTYR